jgi:hypothetical protein
MRAAAWGGPLLAGHALHQHARCHLQLPDAFAFVACRNEVGGSIDKVWTLCPKPNDRTRLLIAPHRPWWRRTNQALDHLHALTPSRLSQTTFTAASWSAWIGRPLPRPPASSSATQGREGIYQHRTIGDGTVRLRVSMHGEMQSCHIA